MSTPAKPERFDPQLPPPGFELKLVPFWQERSKITPRLQLVHTNGASGEGSIESSYNWSLGNLQPGYLYGNPPGNLYRTIPHLQIDRSGRGAMLLPANRKGIANYKAADFSLGFETADSGYLTDPYPTGSFFTVEQAESVAVACAYYAWGFDIPLGYPKAWDGSGTACHTEPFGYPYWTNSVGKPCPGDRKKAQVRDVILPRAQEIVADWTAPPPPPPEDVVTPEDIDAVAKAVWQTRLNTASGPMNTASVIGQTYSLVKTASLTSTQIQELAAVVVASVGGGATPEVIATAVADELARRAVE